MALNTKKAYKRDPIKLSLARTIRPPKSSGYFLFGKTGSGKSVLMGTLSSILQDKYGFKNWDLWGGKRNQGENLYKCLESPYKNYWKAIKRRFRFDKLGPKQYKVNLAYPLTTKLPKDLPYLKNEKDEVIINPKPFTIPIKHITVKMIKFTVNNLSDSDITLWEEVREKLKKSDGMPELVRMFEKRGSGSGLWKNFLKPLVDMRLLSSLDDDNVLDIAREARDREAVFCLIVHHLPEKFRLLILGYIMYQMWDLMNLSKMSGKNVISIREATEFFRATERSTVEPRFKFFKTELSEFIRQARGRMAFILDAQSPSETAGLVEGSSDMVVLGRIPGEDDREEATRLLKRDGKITTEQIRSLGELQKGEYYFIEDGKNAVKRYVFLPPHDFWREKDQNFYKLWAKRMGSDKFKNFEDLKQSIDDRFKIDLKKLRDEEKEKLLKRKQKDDLRERIEEDKRIAEAAEREGRMTEAKARERDKVREKLRREKDDQKANFKKPVPVQQISKPAIVPDKKETLETNNESQLNDDDDLLSELFS